MRVWAISDLHLSFAKPDDRTRFAGRWRDHAATIDREWRRVVAADDLVLLPGDISMARRHRDVQPDLDWLARLPGTKILAPGNHDAWFSGVDRVRPILRRSIGAVCGDAVVSHGVVICGARGCDPSAASASDREARVDELGRALAVAGALRSTDQPVVVLWHFPPFDPYGRPGPAVPLLDSAGCDHCLYGHLHAERQWATATQGIVGRVAYHCVAADSVGFRPRLILDRGGSV